MKIRKNSVVDIVATSSKPNPELFEAVNDYVTSLGFKPRISPDIIAENEPFYANTRLYRANAFKTAMLATDSNIIWALLGGRGATEIIDYLEGYVMHFAKMPTEIPTEKLLIGFSDITVLHSYVIKNYNLPCLHAEMLERIVSNVADKSSVEKLESLLQTSKESNLIYELTKISPEEVGKIYGKVLGGNLTLIENSICTYYDISYADNFLLVEDLNEAPTAIIQSLMHLLYSNKFDKVRALIFADFIANTKENQEYIKWAQNEFVSRLLSSYHVKNNIPVFTLDGVGHGTINNPIFLNADSVIYKKNEKYFMKINNPIEIIGM